MERSKAGAQAERVMTAAGEVGPMTLANNAPPLDQQLVGQPATAAPSGPTRPPLFRALPDWSKPPPPKPQPKPDETIPDRVHAAALVACGYACQRCRIAVVSDDERRTMRLDPTGGDELSNVVVLCLRCARDHDDERRCRAGRR